MNHTMTKTTRADVIMEIESLVEAQWHPTEQEKDVTRDDLRELQELIDTALGGYRDELAPPARARRRPRR